jgi:hypothetical protein
VDVERYLVAGHDNPHASTQICMAAYETASLSTQTDRQTGEDKPGTWPPVDHSQPPLWVATEKQSQPGNGLPIHAWTFKLIFCLACSRNARLPHPVDCACIRQSYVS